MILLYVIAGILLISAIIVAYTRRLKNENLRLEGIIAERTAVVVKQKEELESSIIYASRIQMALLPSRTILAENKWVSELNEFCCLLSIKLFYLNL